MRSMRSTPPRWTRCWPTRNCWLTTDQLVEGTITIVAGVDLTVTKVDGVTYIDGNPILVQNVQATNGVIHVLGAVLVPES